MLLCCTLPVYLVFLSLSSYLRFFPWVSKQVAFAPELPGACLCLHNLTLTHRKAALAPSRVQYTVTTIKLLLFFLSFFNPSQTGPTVLFQNRNTTLVIWRCYNYENHSSLSQLWQKLMIVHISQISAVQPSTAFSENIYVFKGSACRNIKVCRTTKELTAASLKWVDATTHAAQFWTHTHIRNIR